MNGNVTSAMLPSFGLGNVQLRTAVLMQHSSIGLPSVLSPVRASATWPSNQITNDVAMRPLSPGHTASAAS